MKKKSPPYAIIGAVALGILAVVFLVQHEKAQQAAQEAAIAKAKADDQAAIDAANKSHAAQVVETPTHMRNVLYATQPVEAGIRVSAAFFEKKPTPEDILPDAYSDQSDIVGWFATRKIEKGDPLTPRNIGKSLPYMSQRISPGMRAITLPVFNAGDVNNTGGFIVDGDRVDLLYTTSTEDQKYIINTQTVMQNLNILFVPGPTIKTDKTDGINPVGGTVSVTFEVTPEQAQALIFMAGVKNAHFSMILRARKDNSEINIKPFASADYDFLNLKKVQKTVDKSAIRVKQLADEIEAKEKAASSPGNTNETPTPTPPSP